MTSEEQVEMRQTFERQYTGHRDYSYNVLTRKYNCGFTQARWVEFQGAWLAGQRYKPGKTNTQETPTSTRVVRVSRTSPGQ